MKTFYYLATCSTCSRIKGMLPQASDLQFRELKSTPLMQSEVKQLAALAGGFKVLINNRSQQFKLLGIAPKELDETKAETLLSQHYSFLARPVLVIGEQIFIGNTTAVVAQMVNALT